MNNSSPENIKYITDLAIDAYGSSYDNNFLLFKSSQKLYYLIYSTLKKSIISYNLNNVKKIQKIAEIKNAHDDYIDNLRYSYDSKNKRDLILSLSSGNNNIKIWNIKNWEYIFNINDIYKVGSILSACFLLDKNMDYNYIITCNFYLYDIKAIDISGNKEKNKIIIGMCVHMISIKAHYIINMKQ